jgi:hypothetical protein
MAHADEPAAARAATACLNHSTIRTTKVLDNRNVLFTTRDRTTYHNQLGRQCLGMNRTTPLSFTYSDSRLCAGSTFTVMLRTGASSNLVPYTTPGTNEHIALQGPSFVPGPTCELGMFSPVSADEVAALTAATEVTRKSRRRGDRDAIKTEAVEAAPAAQPAPENRK